MLLSSSEVMWISQASVLNLLGALWIIGLKAAEPDTGSVSCALRGISSPPAFSKEGHFIIGGVFSFHYYLRIVQHNYTNHPEPLQCTGRMYTRDLRFARAMQFAIEEINNRSDILPNVVLGYQIHDTCSVVPVASKIALQFANGNDPKITLASSCPKVASVTAVIGDSSTTPSIGMTRLLGLFGVPQVSHFATCACLSNKHEYPAFFRTIPSDHFQAAALAQLVKYFGWMWIGIVRSDSDYGNNGVASFLRAAQKEGICVEYSVAFYRTNHRSKLERIAEVIRSSTSKVILAFIALGEMRLLMEELAKKPPPPLQWIGSESWMTDQEILKSGMFAGAVGFAIEHSVIPGFRRFLLDITAAQVSQSPVLREFWESTFDCTMPRTQTEVDLMQVKLCTGTEDLSAVQIPYTDTSQLRITNMVYKAAYAIAHAIHRVVCDNGQNSQVPRCNKTEFVEPHQVLEQLKKVNFTVNGYPVAFDSNGDPVATYELINWQTGEDGTMQFITVGRYDASQPKGQELSLTKKITWLNGQTQIPVSVCSESCPPGTRKAVQKGRPVCCYDCIPCGEGEISNETDSLGCASCPDEFWPNSKRNECLPKPVEFLSWDEVFGIILAVCSIIGAFMVVVVTGIFYRHRSSPIVRANNSELSFLLLFSLTLCFLCSLTFIGRPSEWSCMLRHTAFGITFVLCISCVLGKTLVVLMAFRATLPGSNVMKWFGPLQQRMTVICFTFVQALICTLWLVLSPPFPSKNLSYYKERIILECNLGSAGAFWAVLGYIGLLAVLCFVLAFLARKLPDNFNEAKFITFSMLIFCAVWITFIPAYVSSPGKLTVAVEIFAILASSFGLILCIFVPKCFIIVFRPEQNTKKHVMGKVPSKAL
ncbi:extracellular calcium-sensing receptor-like [Denticeps clupeoides]|nr:extracellular calcium-sensing receptor-like [Denticeps clupeoides]